MFRYKGLAVLVLGVVTLLLGLTLNYLLPTDETNREQYLISIESRLDRELMLLEDQIQPVIEQFRDGNGRRFSSLSFDTRYSYYIFKNRRLFYWSDNHYIPSYRNLDLDNGVSLMFSEQGVFVVRHWKVQDYIDVVALLPLYEDFSLENRYVSSSYNNRIFGNTNISILDKDTIGDYIFPVHANGKRLFSLHIAPNTLTYNSHTINLIAALLLSSIFLFLIYVLIRVALASRSYRFSQGLLFLIVGLVSIRALMLLIGFPSGFIELDLFDPVFFAASKFNPTLGDFLVNILVVLMIVGYLYQYYYKTRIYKTLIKSSSRIKDVLGLMMVTVGLFLVVLLYLTVQAVYYNSQYSFDITRSLDFSFLRGVVFMTYITATVIFFLFYHVLFRIVKRIVNPPAKLLLMLIIGSALLYPLTVSNPIPFWSIVIINAVYFSILYILDLPRTLMRFRYAAYVYLFLAALIASVIGSMAISHYEDERSLNDQKRFANQFLVENDLPAEFLLNEVTEEVKNDVYIISHLLNPFMSKEIIGEKIRRAYLSNYLDKYNVEINVYNSNGDPVTEKSTVANYFEIRESFALEQYATDYPNIFFVNRAGVDVTKRYLVFIDIARYNVNVGYIILDLSLKKILPNTVYPELLVDTRYLEPLIDNSYSYAVFSGTELVYHSGPFNYEVEFDEALLDQPELQENGYWEEGWRHIAVEDTDQRTVVVSGRYERLDVIISNFSFLFLLLVIIILTLIGMYMLLARYPKISLNYAAKIQLNLNLAFFLPLFIVSFVTLSLINSSLRREITSDHIANSEVVADNIIQDLDQYLRGVLDQEEFSTSISRIAEVAGVDVSVYNITGRLIGSSQPLIFQNGLLSNYINPDAMIEIMEKRVNSVILKEQIGSLEFDDTYIAIKSFDTGNIMAILSVPYFDSRNLLQDQQINVFTTIINIFSIIFIIFLGISYFLSKWLTLPLNFIARRIRRTTLADTQPINWQSDDEIGMLVNEYNRMLLNLEASKKALARSEKESAWREIAQQVAHEIKNPLTPMKLTLQQLQRTLSQENGEKKGFSQKPIRNLLHQIDTLNDIATSFSTFAKMPIPANERFDLAMCLRKTLGIYQNVENTAIKYDEDVREVFVIGDEQLTGRIFSNIIINSIQSAVEGRPLQIQASLRLSEDGRRVTVSISDNGAGISEDVQNKVFVPNFSTKESGSGIGLAIAKHGIEHAGGTIWFESRENEGTTFHIELPIVP